MRSLGLDKNLCLDFLRKQSGIVSLRDGSCQSKMKMKEIQKQMLAEAEIFAKANVDALLVENMHDVPWLRAEYPSPETTASLAVLCAALRSTHPAMPIGLQILSARNRDALAVAAAADLNFIRAEGFVYSHVRMGGGVDSCAADLLRYRRYIGADNVLIFTDIKKKHSAHALTADVSLEETAQAAEMFLSDGLIVSGRATGHPADPSYITRVKDAVSLPVLVGSGVTADNVHQYMAADALIVGSSLKHGDLWSNVIDEKKVQRLVDKLNTLRSIHPHSL